MAIIWDKGFSSKQEPAPALLTKEETMEETKEEIIDEQKPSPKETVRGFGLGK